MRTLGAVVAALTMACVALAGCGSAPGGGGSSAIRVENLGAPGGPGPYRFTALVGSEGEYTWDLGDHLTVKTGQTVEHTYDFKDSAPDRRGQPGNVTVTLRVVEAGAAKAHTVSFRLGTGLNRSPAFVLDGQTNWAVLGENVTFSAARSTDADGDTLRYRWQCLVATPDEKLVNKGLHAHPGLAAYKPPSAGSVTSYMAANLTLPEPTQVFPCDLCDAIAAGTEPSTGAATVQGSFTRRGLYKVFLYGSDGPHAEVSGAFDIYVTRPDERPAPWQRSTFTANLTAGLDPANAGVGLEQFCDAVPSGPAQQESCDHATWDLEFPLPPLAAYINVTYNDRTPATAPGVTNNLTWAVLRGSATVKSGSSPNSQEEFPPAYLLPGDFKVDVRLKQGSQVQVRIQVDARLNVDPQLLY
jgi:hypothetical protein